MTVDGTGKPGDNTEVNFDARLIREGRIAAGPLALAVLGGLASGALAVLQARLLSHILTLAFLGGQDLPGIAPWILGLLATVGVRALSGYFSETAGSAAAEWVKNALRDRLLEALRRLGPLYTSTRPTGEITATVVQGIDALDAYFSQFLPQAALAGLVPLTVLVFVFPLDPLTGLILLLTGPLIPVFMFLIGSESEKLTAKQYGALSRMSGFFLDTLQGLRTLKTLGRSREQAGRIASVSRQYRDATLSVLRVTFLSALALELLGTLSTAVIAVQIGLRLLAGGIGFEAAFFLLVIAPDFYLPLRTLGLRFHAAMNGVSAARSIYALLEESEAVSGETGHPHSGAVVQAPLHIRFREVTWRYPNRDTDALDRVSFDLNAGEMLAVIGPSGAGKTSLVQALLGFIQPQAGSIEVNGTPLREMDLQAWREQIAWVGQQPHLSAGTLGENLRLARPEASETELMACLEQARLMDWFRSLPNGLNSDLGEAAARVSGGQAQRIGVARAFLRNAPLLVLDEPTAHLDLEEEALLESSLRELARGRTTLVIAHRLATLRNADRVVVLRAGQVVEAGTPSELFRAGGAYVEMIRQAGGAV